MVKGKVAVVVEPVSTGTSAACPAAAAATGAQGRLSSNRPGSAAAAGAAAAAGRQQPRGTPAPGKPLLAEAVAAPSPHAGVTIAALRLLQALAGSFWVS